jgi:hypothetical protein
VYFLVRGAITLRYKTFVLSTVALLVTANATNFWLTKDWHDWTPEECHQILTDSPWTSQIILVFAHVGTEPGPLGPRAVIVSSLAVRQARASLGIDGPQFTCVSERFDDRVVIRFSEGDLFKSPPDLIVSGRRIPPLAGHRPNSDSCSIGGGSDISYPRVLNGQAVFKSGKNNLEIQTNVGIEYDRNNPVEIDTRFRFNTKNMLYKGKPDF